MKKHNLLLVRPYLHLRHPLGSTRRIRQPSSGGRIVSRRQMSNSRFFVAGAQVPVIVMLAFAGPVGRRLRRPFAAMLAAEGFRVLRPQTSGDRTQQGTDGRLEHA